MKEIGEMLKACRQSRHLTLKELGKRAGISSAQISNIEHGKTLPKIDTLLKILWAMDYDLELLDIRSP